jgi:chaperonin GroEL
MSRAKELMFESEAREKMVQGVRILAKAVRTTLGPKGRNVIIESPDGLYPRVTKDGVSVAKQIFLEDQFQNLGAQMVKQAASRTAEMAGDGTTTSTVLAEAIIELGSTLINEHSYNPIMLKRGMDKAYECCVKKIAELAKPIDGIEDVRRVATISTNSDHELGNLITEAIAQVGSSGVIIVEPSPSYSSSVEFTEGMEIASGLISNVFSTSKVKPMVEYETPYILFCAHEITNMRDLIPITEAVVKSGKPLIVIAPDIQGEALSFLAINYQKGAAKVCPIKAPAVGDRQLAIMEDMAILTGGVVFGLTGEAPLDKARLEDLGQCKRIKVTPNFTTIVEGAGLEEDLNDRTKYISSLIDDAKTDYERDKQRERLASLTNGVAVIKIGSASETELHEKKDRIDDALAATKSAAQEGIVPGGGVTLVRLSQFLDELIERETDQEIIAGISILQDAMKMPTYYINKNAGIDPEEVIQNILDSDEFEYGFNTKEEIYGNMIDMGVIDPAKVVRCALENAISAAGLLLTSDCAIVSLDTARNGAGEWMPY